MAKTADDPRLELLQGTLDMLILKTLRRGPQHGYGIGQAIRAQSDDVLKAETGSLYPALHRLEKHGWIKSEWGVSEANQRAKYDGLTAAGKAQLLRERDRWSQLVDAIGRIMNPRAGQGVARWRLTSAISMRKSGSPRSQRERSDRARGGARGGEAGRAEGVGVHPGATMVTSRDKPERSS